MQLGKIKSVMRQKPLVLSGLNGLYQVGGDLLEGSPVIIGPSITFSTDLPLNPLPGREGSERGVHKPQDQDLRKGEKAQGNNKRETDRKSLGDSSPCCLFSSRPGQVPSPRQGLWVPSLSSKRSINLRFEALRRCSAFRSHDLARLTSAKRRSPAFSPTPPPSP